jgi:hypothetical protein
MVSTLPTERRRWQGWGNAPALAGRADGSSFDELRRGVGGFALVLTETELADPTDDVIHHRAGVPPDVGDFRLAPVEERMGVTADQRNIFP